MTLLWAPAGWADYQHWIETDKDLLARVNALIRDIRRDPFKGLGRPEPLKAMLFRQGVRVYTAIFSEV